MSYPKVGIGLIIINHSQEILLGKRKNSLGAGLWGPVGGHLEFGESFEDCAKREALEEAGLIVNNMHLVGIDNTIYSIENMHYVSIIFAAQLPNNQYPINREPSKLENWHWFNLHNLPHPLFLPLDNIIQNLGHEKFIEKLMIG